MTRQSMASPSNDLFLIKAAPEFAPAIGHLVAMMRYARFTTLNAVEGLSVAALDHLLDDEANSIGMLLEHMACVEESYQAATFGWALSPADEERVTLGGNLGAVARDRIRGHDLQHYRNRLASVRSRTLVEFARRDERWLFEEGEFWFQLPANNYFKWFHVFEDEINHRGQIRFIRKRLPTGI